MSVIKAFLHGAFGRAAFIDVRSAVAIQASPQICIMFKTSDADLNVAAGKNGYRMTGADMLVINPWQPYSYQPTCSVSGSRVLALYIYPAWLLDRLVSWCDRPEKTYLLQRKSELCKTFVGRITNYMMHDGRFSVALADRLFESLSIFFKAISKNDNLCWQENTGQLRVRDFRVRRAMSYLRANLGEEFDCGDVASASGLSRPHLFKMFREQTGLTPRLFYNALRLENAYSWLGDRNISLQQISLDLGFSAQSNFARFFRSHLGIPPAEYRRNLRTIPAGDIPPHTEMGLWAPFNHNR